MELERTRSWQEKLTVGVLALIGVVAIANGEMSGAGTTCLFVAAVIWRGKLRRLAAE